MFTTKFYTRDGKVHFAYIDMCATWAEAIDKTITALDAEGAWLVAENIVIKKSEICAFEVFFGEIDGI